MTLNRLVAGASCAIFGCAMKLPRHRTARPILTTCHGPVVGTTKTGFSQLVRLAGFATSPASCSVRFVKRELPSFPTARVQGGRTSEKVFSSLRQILSAMLTAPCASPSFCSLRFAHFPLRLAEHGTPKTSTRPQHSPSTARTSALQFALHSMQGIRTELLLRLRLGLAAR